MPSQRRCQLTPASFGRAGTLLVLALLRPLVCQSIHLDVHVPLPAGCLNYYALLANRLLRETSRPVALPQEHVSQPSERVDLFSRHTPHVTLYLADFDLESAAPEEDGADTAAPALNATKVEAFLGAIAALNFTEIIAGGDCPLAFAQEQHEQATASYFNIQGDYVMLPIGDTPCLQTLSTTLLHALKSYVRQPVVVPSWVASLPEPERSSAIFRTRTYGSPNVLDGFAPHVTVGFDPAPPGGTAPTVRSGLQRAETMEEWNAAYEPLRQTCIDAAQEIAVGKTGRGGTVLANSRMGSWDLNLVGKTQDEGTAPRNVVVE